MLNNLDWLGPNQAFPPECEMPRLSRYRQNKLVFNNDHQTVYREQLKRIEKVVGNVSEIISYPIVLNFQKKISLKTADFLFMEPPVFKADDEKKQKAIDEIVGVSDLYAIGYEGAIDCSRYGTAVYKIDVEDNKARIAISSPEYLYMIVDPDDRKKILNYVVAWTYMGRQNGKETTYLKAVIHSKGSYRAMVFEMAEKPKGRTFTIGRLIDDSGEIPTGLSDFAVVPVHNMLTSDSVFGVDDYMDVDSIVSELEIRTAQISKILDVFASPTVSGSTGALEPDGLGGYTFNAGNYYARNNVDEPPLEYIVWNANLEANFRQVEKLINYLCVISEMGAAVFNADMQTGNIPSGSALRKMYINVLAKVARVRSNFDKGLKKAISLASEIGYTKVEMDEISITWQDGLPNDPKEEADIMSVRTGGKSTMSVERALKMFDGMDDGAIEAEKQLMEGVVEDDKKDEQMPEDEQDEEKVDKN